MDRMSGRFCAWKNDPGRNFSDVIGGFHRNHWKIITKS